jgi:hypothetical protein
MIQTLHPNTESLPIEVDQIDEPDSAEMSVPTVSTFAKIKRIRENEEEIQRNVPKTSILKEFLVAKGKSELDLNLNLDGKEMVKFVKDLVFGLDLTVKSAGRVGFNDRTRQFAESITYDVKEGNAFRNEIYENKGYLYDEGNYFWVDDKFTTPNTKVVTLRNSRVILFWRGFDFGELNIKRIISLGFCFLIRTITEAELYNEISKIIPKGDLSVSVKHKRDAYVLIGIEKHPFLY